MDKQQKRLMRKIRRRRRRKYGGFRDDEELLEGISPAHDSKSAEVLRLQGLIGNQAVQRLMNDSGDGNLAGAGVEGLENGVPDSEDNGPQSESETAEAVMALFQKSPYYKSLMSQFSEEQLSNALEALKEDAAQFLQLLENKHAAFPMLKYAVQKHIENEAKAKEAEKKAPQKAGNPYPFLPVIQRSVNRVLIPDPPPPPKEAAVKLDEEKGEATQDKTQEELKGGDFTDGKDPGTDIEDRTIENAVNTKITIEGMLQGIYRQMPEETMKEFQEVHDTLRVSSGYIAHKTREKAREAHDALKIVMAASKEDAKAPIVDPLQNSIKEAEGMKDNVLKAAMDARMAITDIIANKPDVADEAIEEKTAEQEKEIAAAAAGEDDGIALPDVGAIKAQGFVMSHNKMLNKYITLGKSVRSSDAASGIYAEQRVVQDLINTPNNKTVIILAAHEPVQARRQAIREFAFKRPDLKVYVCYVHGALVATGNRMIDASGGNWADVIHFR